MCSYFDITMCSYFEIFICGIILTSRFNLLLFLNSFCMFRYLEITFQNHFILTLFFNVYVFRQNIWRCFDFGLCFTSLMLLVRRQRQIRFISPVVIVVIVVSHSCQTVAKLTNEACFFLDKWLKKQKNKIGLLCRLLSATSRHKYILRRKKAKLYLHLFR